jgi:hypothetical protein
MKNILVLILTYIIGIQLSLANLPPTTIKGQAGTKSTVFNFEVPNHQATKTGGVNQLIETGNKNLLQNPNFEHQTYDSGWTASGTGTRSAETSQKISGDKAWKCVVSSQTCNLQQDTTINASELSGVQGVLKVWAKNTANATLCPRVNGSKQTSICLTLDKTGVWKEYEIPFLLGGTSSGIDIDVTSSTGTIIVDDAYVGVIPDGSIYEAAAVGPWVDYGPMTITATSTNPTKATTKQEDNVRCRIVGEDYECEYRYRADSNAGAAAGSGGYLFHLPSGIEYADSQPLATISTAVGASGDTTDTSRAASTIGKAVAVGNGASAHYTGFAVAVSSNRFQVCILNGATNAGCINSGFYQLNLNNTAYHFRIKFRGKNLNPRISLYSQQCIRATDCENVFSAKVTSAGVVSEENLDWISGNCSLSSGAFTCNFNSSIFSVTPNCVANFAQTASGVISSTSSTQVTDATASSVIVRTFDATYNAAARPFTLVCQKQGSDYKFRNIITGTFQDVVTSPNGGRVALCSAEILSGGIITKHIGGCFASCTNATTPVCTFTSNYWNGVPNCWHSSDSWIIADAVITANDFTGFVVNSSWVPVAANRRYFCQGRLK